MLMWASGLEFVDALKELAKMYGVALPRPAAPERPAVHVEPTRAEYIAGKCMDALRTPEQGIHQFVLMRPTERAHRFNRRGEGGMGRQLHHH